MKNIYFNVSFPQSTGWDYGISNVVKGFTESSSKILELDRHSKFYMDITLPHMFNYIKGKFNILYAMYEAEDLPTHYINKIQEPELVIVPCEHNKKVFSKYRKGPIEVIPLGYNPNIFKFQERHYRKEINGFGIKEQPFTFLYVGATNPRKNFQMVIDAFRELQKKYPEINLYFKTTGQEKEQIINDNGLIFDSRDLSQGELAQIYYQSHCFVFPSSGEGWGLCVDPNTIIQTNLGTKKMLDIKINDNVLTRNGWNRVLGKSERVSDTYSVFVEGGIETIVSPEHPFLSIKRNGNHFSFIKNKIENNIYKPEWRNIKELKCGDFVGIPRPNFNKQLPEYIDLVDYVKGIEYDDNYVWFNMGYSPLNTEWSIKFIMEKYNESKHVVENALKIKYGKKNFKKNTREYNLYKLLENEPIIEKIPNKISRKIKIDNNFLKTVGWYIAEGSGNGDKNSFIQFSLHKKEESVAIWLAEYFSKTFNASSNIYFPKDKLSCNLNVSSKIIAEFFREFCGSGSYNKYIHKILLESEKYLGPLIFSYLQGDGCLKNFGNSIRFSTTSENLIWQIRNICSTMGIYVNVSKSIRRGKYFWIGNIGGEDLIKINDWLNMDINIIKTSRKIYRKTIVTEDCIFVPIRKINYNKEKTIVMDIEVENNHEFVGNGLLLHNTVMEAMATGTPVIHTGYSGLEFAKSEYTYHIKYELKDTHIDVHNLDTQWAFPDFNDLVSKMDYVYNNYDEAKEKAYHGSNYIKQFSWDNNAKLFKNIIERKIHLKDRFESICYEEIAKEIPEYKILNLGCGKNIIPWADNLDFRNRYNPDIIKDLNDKEWKLDKYDEIVALDVIEHLPDIENTMSNIHKSLKDNGVVFIKVPLIQGENAFRDPTHKIYFTADSFDYFDKSTYIGGMRDYFDFNFKILNKKITEILSLEITMRKV